MTKIENYLSSFIKRRDVARAKVQSGYRTDYFSGVADAYDEVINDIEKIVGRV